jgi:type II secretory pathway predicted ATPase ExeA
MAASVTQSKIKHNLKTFTNGWAAQEKCPILLAPSYVKEIWTASKTDIPTLFNKVQIKFTQTASDAGKDVVSCRVNVLAED